MFTGSSACPGRFHKHVYRLLKVTLLTDVYSASMPYFFFRKWLRPDREPGWMCIDTADNFTEAKLKQARYMGLESAGDFTIHTEFGRTEKEARRGLNRASRKAERLEPALKR